MEHFSLKHYTEILLEAQKNFTIIPFNQLNEDFGEEHLIILRHDIDSSLDYALEMARAEFRTNVKSTYFVQLHSDFYSLISSGSIAAVQKIIALGHEIGFHYDPLYYDLKGMSFYDGLSMDLDYLNRTLGFNIVSVSRHMPLLSEQDEEFPTEIKYNAYDKRFINGDFKYLSDSNGVFREGCFCNHIQTEQDYCFLVHPIWWVAKGEGWQEKLLNQKEIEKNRCSHLIDNKIDTYSQIMIKRDEYDAKFKARKS